MQQPKYTNRPALAPASGDGGWLAVGSAIFALYFTRRRQHKWYSISRSFFFGPSNSGLLQSRPSNKGNTSPSLIYYFLLRIRFLYSVEEKNFKILKYVLYLFW
jgi:hypothetical protein